MTTSLKVVPNHSDGTIEAFLKFLYGTVEGYIYVPSKLRTPGETKDPWTQKFFKWPDQRLQVTEYILETTQAEEVYISPSMFAAEDSRKESFLGSWVVWIEHDGKLPEDLQEVPEPTLKLQSSDSKHEHWYWKLSEFANDIKWLEEVNRSLSYKLGADTSGWDANQVLRPPNTLNHKRNRQVKVLSVNDWHFDPSRFDVVERPPVATTIYDESNLLDMLGIIARNQFTDADLSLIRDKNVSEGERSTRLMQVGYRCAEIGLNDQEIFTILYHADEWWGKFHDRRDRDQRLNDIIVRARLKHPNNATIVEVFSLPVMGTKQLLDSHIELNWAIESCLESNGCFLLSAKPGIGKTRLSIQAAISLALGVPFLKYNVPQPLKVGFFSLEMHQAGIQSFVKKMTGDYSPETISQLEEQLKFIPLGKAFNVLDPTNTGLISSFIEQYELDVVFFDSLGRVTNKSLNSDEDTKTLFDWDSTLRGKHGIATWYVHHNRKATAQNKQPKTQDDVYGSVYVTAGPTDVYALWSKEITNSTIFFINLKHRYSAQEREYGLETKTNLMFKPMSGIKEKMNVLGISEAAPTTGPIVPREISEYNDLGLEEPKGNTGSSPGEIDF